MKVVICAILIFLLLCSCANSKKLNKMPRGDSIYLIKQIDSINNWYIIYAAKQDSSFKIIVKKDNYCSDSKSMIVIGKYYNLVLHSRKNEVPEINGIKIKPVNSLDVQCYAYDEATNICIQPKKGIYDLYHTANIKGLCYLEQRN